MNRLWFSFLAWVTLASSVPAVIDDRPDYTLLWNNFSSVTIVDSFAVVTADDGVMACSYDRLTGVFEPVNYLFLNSPPWARKRFGSVLTVRSITDILYFVDISDLPDLNLLGKAPIDVEYHDFALDGQSLYICAGFDGLLRYTLDDYSSPSLADSSMIGVHYTRAEINGGRMYALDDYNGLLSYDLSGDGFGRFLSYLHIPIQATELLVLGSEIVISTVANKILLADFTDSGLVVPDTLYPKLVPAAVFASDAFIFSVAGSHRHYDLFTRDELTRYSGVLTGRLDDGLQGDVLSVDGGSRVVFPADAGGLLMYDLNGFPAKTLPTAVYDRPGPIRDIILHNERLYAGGLTNPLDAYDIDIDGKPSYSFTTFGNLDNVRAVSHHGDSMFALYPQVPGIVLFEVVENELVYDTLLETDPIGTLGIKYNSRQIGEYHSLFAIGAEHLDIYTFSDTVDITYLGRLITLGRILDVEILDSLLIFSTDKYDLWVYRIYDDFSFEFRSTIGTGTCVNDLVPLPPDTAHSLNSRLIAFADDQMLSIDMDDPLQPSVELVKLLPIRAENSALVGNLLYTIGRDGIGIFNVSSAEPVLVDCGGRGGTMICVENGIAATSDGSAVHLYDLRGVFPTEPFAFETESAESFSIANYPNPFNLSTSIAYHLPDAGVVELAVYNLLGQKVITLVDGSKTSGSHVAVWEGRDSRGRPVASGAYFYRLTVGNHAETRKMILIK